MSQVECKKAQPKEVMLPATIARGRAVARGYGELLMLNPGVSSLAAFRYSPYTVPSSAAAVAAAVAANPSVAAVSNPITNQCPTSLQPMSGLNLSTNVKVSMPNAMTRIVAPAQQTANGGAVTPTQLQQLQQQQIVAAALQNSSAAAAAAAAAAANANPNLLNITQQQTGQVTPRVQVLPSNQQAQQLQQLQQLQLLGVDSSSRLLQHTQATAVPSTSANLNLAHLATSLTVANGTAASLAAASCKSRATLPAVALGGPTADSAAAGMNYSMNELINLQTIQPLEAASTFQVPVGL